MINSVFFFLFFSLLLTVKKFMKLLIMLENFKVLLLFYCLLMKEEKNSNCFFIIVNNNDIGIIFWFGCNESNVGIKGFKLYCFFMGGFLISFFYFIFLSGWNKEVGSYSDFMNFFGVILYVDKFSFYLSLLVLILFICLMPLMGSHKSLSSLLLMGFTGMSSMMCFVVGKSLLFWIFYESAMIIILFLLYIDSPYSERFLAGWYLLGYSIFSGLPFSWGFCCFSLWSGKFLFIDWCSLDTIWLFVILGFLFTTKMPFAPFHVWLSIVHAEASTPVSVCLSGYMMKLSVMGALRVIFFNA